MMKNYFETNNGRRGVSSCQSIVHKAMMLVSFVLMYAPSQAQDLNDDGSKHTISYDGSYQDFTVPNNPQITRITFTLVGGDGGTAKVSDVILGETIDFKSKGGRGAFVSAAFSVGSSGAIPLGSTVRFVVGEKGKNGSSGAIVGSGLDWGSGGGGSAVLYKGPSDADWTLLAVAGGGGGAYQGMFNWTNVDGNNGQGGRSGTGGGAGNGDIDIGLGGSGGNGGTSPSSVLGGPGGGAFTGGNNSSDYDGAAGGTTGGPGGGEVVPGLDRGGRHGGFGFGGGGLAVGAGGGGGGYSGGGGGGTTGRGGGGGSFVSNLKASGEIISGGSTGTPINGQASYEIQKASSPVAICKSVLVVLDNRNIASVSARDLNLASFDPQGEPLTFSLSQSSFGCQEVGSNLVVFTATNASGLSSTCDAIVNVVDNTFPTVFPNPTTVVELDQNGDGFVTAQDVNFRSNDNCGFLASLEISKSLFSCSDLGTQQVTMTAIDLSGNKTTGTANIDIQDNRPPVAKAKSGLIVTLDAAGNAKIEAVDLDDGSSDNCSIASYSLDRSSFSCSDVGFVNLVLTVTDASGNTAIDQTTVQIIDVEKPTVQGGAILLQLDASGDAMLTDQMIQNISTDACGIASVSVGQSNFDCSHLGDNTVAIAVTDINGNIKTVSRTVTIQDNVNPTVMMQGIRIELDANGEATVSPSDIDAGSTDNCSIVSRMVTPASFTCSDLGMNTITLEIEDDSGNQASKSLMMEVVDVLAPSVAIAASSIYLGDDGRATLKAVDFDAGSTDNCGIASRTVSPTTVSCTDVGTVNVTLEVTDLSGNKASKSILANVIDDTPPELVITASQIVLDDNGEANLNPLDFDASSTDNCGIASRSVSPSTVTCADVGNVDFTFEMADVNGNKTSKVVTMEVIDETAPDVLIQAPTIVLDANGQATLDPLAFDAGSTDNCAIASFNMIPETVSCSDVGLVSVTLGVIDVSGNRASKSILTSVVDDTPPTVAIQAPTIFLDAGGQATLDPRDFDAGSTDNCGIASYLVSPTSVSCGDVGTVDVTLEVTDVNGNKASKTISASVLDEVKPVAQTKDITISLDASGNATVSPGDIDDGSSDACGISLQSSKVNFDCADLGANTISLIVTDPSGNMASMDAVVTVVDQDSPDIEKIEPSQSFLWPPNQKMVDVVMDVDLVDNCTASCKIIDVRTNEPSDVNTAGDWTILDDQIVSLRPVPSNPANARIYTVILQCTDQSGNTAISTTDIKVARDGAGDALAINPNPTFSQWEELEIWNNPSIQHVPFTLQLPQRDDLNQLHLHIFDASGREVEHRILSNWSASSIEIGADYSPGFYLGTIQDGRVRSTFKLVKQ